MMPNSIPKCLKVAHVIPEINLNITGGVGVFLQTLTSCLDRDRVENVIVTYKSDESDRNFFQDLSIPVFSRLLTADEEIEPSIQVMEWLMETFQTISPDVVHTNLFWGDTLGRQAAYRVKVPVIVTTENNRDLHENSRQQRLKRKLANLTDCIVCVSEGVKQHLREVDGVPDERMMTIYNGIILEKYPFDCREPESQSPLFVSVGRLEPQKVPLRLIDAFSVIAAEYSDCQLSIIGDGSLMKNCCDSGAAFGLTQRVQFWGYQPQPWRTTPPGSIFVMTSDYEGHPLVVLEAMATGHLCIIPDIPGIPEMAEAGVEALIYKAGDRSSLLAAMGSALEMPSAQRQQIIKAARARVERDFDAYKMAEKYLHLYQKLYAEKEMRVIKRQLLASNS